MTRFGINPRAVLISVLAVLLALVVGAVLIVLGRPDVLATLSYFFARPGDFFVAAGGAVGEAYAELFLGAFGDASAIADTLVQATPLIFAGLGVTIAFRAGLFNIGAQGQLMIGALCAAYVGFAFDLPPVLHLVAALLAGVLGGGIWGGVVGLLKARTGAHEVILTIMLNYVATSLVSWLLITEAFQRPGRTDPITPVVGENAALPRFGGTQLNVGFLLALLAVLVVWWLLNRSTLGFEVRAVGSNREAARTAGMNVAKVLTIAMLLAGVFAGLAGAHQVLGVQGYLTGSIAGSVGFDAITVALLGRGTPVGTLFAALLFGALNAGSREMQAATETPLTLSIVLQATIVLFVAAPVLVRTVFRLRDKRTGSGGAFVAAEGGTA